MRAWLVKQLAAAQIGLIGLGLGSCWVELRAEPNTGDCQASVMLEQLQLAMEQPELVSSQRVVVRYGTDQRYYLMIRGWLSQRLQGLESQLGAQGDNTERVQQLQARIEALRGLIRQIDLE